PRLGLHALALGWVGRDFFGDQIMASLRQEAVDVEHVLRLEGRTTVSTVLVDREGQHVFVGSIGVRGPEHLPGEWEPVVDRAMWVMSDGWVLVQNPDPIEEALARAHAHGRTTGFDPGPLLHRVPEERVGKVLAAVAGAVAVSKLGTGTAMPTRQEMAAFLAAHRLGIDLPHTPGGVM